MFRNKVQSILVCFKYSAVGAGGQRSAGGLASAKKIRRPQSAKRPILRNKKLFDSLKQEEIFRRLFSSSAGSFDRCADRMSTDKMSTDKMANRQNVDKQNVDRTKCRTLLVMCQFCWGHY